MSSSTDQRLFQSFFFLQPVDTVPSMYTSCKFFNIIAYNSDTKQDYFPSGKFIIFFVYCVVCSTLLWISQLLLLCQLQYKYILLILLTSMNIQKMSIENYNGITVSMYKKISGS